MNTDIFAGLGHQIRARRAQKGLTQPELASRLGRNQARISELERDLIRGRLGRDRLTLFVEMCDALDLVPILVPRSRAGEVRALIDGDAKGADAGRTVRPVFDELFVDLGDDDEDND